MKKNCWIKDQKKHQYQEQERYMTIKSLLDITLVFLCGIKNPVGCVLVDNSLLDIYSCVPV